MENFDQTYLIMYEKIQNMQRSIYLLNYNTNKSEIKSENLINELKNSTEDYINNVLIQLNQVSEELEKKKFFDAEQMKTIKEGILQNKIVNKTVCGNI
jgi:hypothetical protein